MPLSFGAFLRFTPQLSHTPKLYAIMEKERLVAYNEIRRFLFHLNRSLNDRFITLEALIASVDKMRLGIMNRKTITLDADIIDALNKKRLGGETWNDFFRRIIERVPERNDWERGVKND